MEKEYTIEQMAETRWFYKFIEPNAKGETLIIELTKCINLNAENDKKSLPYMWYKTGCKDRILTTFWSIHTYVRDTEGSCYEKYNPQVIVMYTPETETIRPVINFAWMFEATEENKQKLIDEIYRLFSTATGKTATEIKLDKIKEFANERKVSLFNELPNGWKVLKGALTAPTGAAWISNMKPFKSGEMKRGLLLIK